MDHNRIMREYDLMKREYHTRQGELRYQLNRSEQIDVHSLLCGLTKEIRSQADSTQVFFPGISGDDLERERIIKSDMRKGKQNAQEYREYLDEMHNKYGGVKVTL